MTKKIWPNASLHADGFAGDLPANQKFKRVLLP